MAVDAGRTDTAHSTCLHVPSIGLIVGGDAIYNGIHPFLGETDRQSRLEWISTLDKLEALKPRAVIAGHKIPENDDDPRIIGRHGNISRISIAWTRRRRPRASSTTRCSNSIPTAPIPARSGAPRNIAKKQAQA